MCGGAPTRSHYFQHSVCRRRLPLYFDRQDGEQQNLYGGACTMSSGIEGLCRFRGYRASLQLQATLGKDARLSCVCIGRLSVVDGRRRTARTCRIPKRPGDAKFVRNVAALQQCRGPRPLGDNVARRQTSLDRAPRGAERLRGAILRVPKSVVQPHQQRSDQREQEAEGHHDDPPHRLRQDGLAPEKGAAVVILRQAV